MKYINEKKVTIKMIEKNKWMTYAYMKKKTREMMMMMMARLLNIK